MIRVTLLLLMRRVKALKLRAEPAAAMWRICIVNSVEGGYRMENGKLLSTKRKSGKGIGLARSGVLAERYGGYLLTYPEEKEFTALLYLPWGSGK